MCYFITIAVPQTQADDFIAAVPRGMAAQRVAIRSIARRLPDCMAQLVLTSGGCSCDLYYSGESERPSREEHIEKLRAKYKKRKWSEAKVERAIDEALAKRESDANRESDSVKAGLDAHVRDLIADFVEAHGDLQVVVHFYSGEVETERFDIHKKVVIRSTDLRADGGRVSEDELVRVSAVR